MGLHPTSRLGLSFMILLFWFLIMVCLVSLSDFCPLCPARILLGLIQSPGVLKVNDSVEGQLCVKRKMMFERWLMVGERWLNHDRSASKRVRYASISYETWGTGEDFSGEDFQNTGTFIVVRSSVFAKSSVHKSHLARDAYNAY